MNRSINWFIFAVAVVSMTSLQTATNAFGRDEEITRHLDSFMVDYTEAFGIVRERFGDDRERIPQHLLEIMDDVIGRNSGIVTEARRLRAEGSDIERNLLDGDEIYLDTKEEAFEKGNVEFLRKAARWTADATVFNAEYETHKASWRLLKTEQERRRWRQEDYRFQVWRKRLADRKAQGLRGLADLDEREKDLKKKRKSLRERRAAHYKRIRQLNRDIDDFSSQCVAASDRLLVLAEMASVWSESGRDAGGGRTGSRFSEEMANIIGPAAIKQLGYKSLGGGVGHVLTVLDIAALASNEYECEIQRRLLIIGDYAEAIESLKYREQLRQGDRRYEALRHMMRMSGRSMPTSATEFNVQALGTAKTLGNGLAAVASHYLGNTLAKSGETEFLSTFETDKLFWASQGILRGVVQASNDILGNMIATINIRTYSSLVAQQRERAKARRR